MLVAERLKRIVDQRGISYSSIAARAGLTIDAVSRSFLGKRKLQADEMIAICKVVNVDITELTDNADLPS